MVRLMKTTAREALATIGITDPESLTRSNGSGWNFDQPAILSPAWTGATGALQANCGGECLFRIDWQTGHRRPAYVVRDDEDGSRWDNLRRVWASSPDVRTWAQVAADNGLTHYRPHARIRIVQAG